MNNGNDNNSGGNNRRPIGGQGSNNYAKYGGNSNNRYVNNRPPINRYVEGGANNGQYNPNQGNQYNNGQYNNNQYNQNQGNMQNPRRAVGGPNNYNQIKGLSDDYVNNSNSAIVEGDGMGTSKMDPEDKKKLIKKRIKMGFKIFFVSMLLGIIVAGVVVYVKYGKDILQLREDAKIEVEKKNKQDFMKFAKNKYYGFRTGANGEKEIVEINMGSGNDKYISISDGGENMVLARELMICSEDRGFYSHGGVDLWASTKAVILAIMNGGNATRGGSTITQQLARNVVLEDFDKNWKRKVKEMFVSWELEDKFEKDEIIEFYLNNINYGNGYMGIENAAYGYFGKSVKDLSKGQVAFLCSIPNNPAMFNPYNMDSNNDPKNAQKAAGYKVNYNTSVRKNRLLEQMNKYSKSKLDKADFTAAVEEKVEVLAESSGSSADGPKVPVNMMLQTYIRRCAYDKIISTEFKNEFSYQYPDEWATDAEREAYVEQYNEMYQRAKAYLTSGTTTKHIYTSIDVDMVQALQEAIDEGIPKTCTRLGNEMQKSVAAKGMHRVQGAAVTMDDSGYVVAMVNSRTGEGGVVNSTGRAFGMNNSDDAMRKNEYWKHGNQQPGSAIKPLLVYGPYFEENAEKEGFCFLDEPVEDSKEYIPADGKRVGNSGSYLSPNIREAIKHSSNVVAYKILENKDNKYGLGTRKGLNYLKKMNFNFLASNENTRASIGGTVGGVTPLEMCAAYSYILMDMTGYIRPTCVKVISDKKILSATEVDTHSQAKQSGTRTVFSADTKSRLIEGMQGVFEPGGTAANYKLNTGWQAAGKTGTTNNNVDGWFCGGTPKYTTAIWIGDDTGSSDIGTGSAGSARIWRDYYNAIAKNSRIKRELDSKPNFNFKYEYSQTIIPEPTEDPNATFDPFGEMPMPSETTFTYMPSFSPDPDDDDDDNPFNPKQSPSPTPGLPTVPGGNNQTPDPDDDSNDSGNSNGNSNGNTNGNNNNNNGGAPSRP